MENNANYTKAAQQKLRVQTSKGPLSVEQLFDLSVTELDTLAVSLDEQYNQSGKKSFLTTRSEKDKDAKLRFDIVRDIMTIKQAEQEVLTARKEKKERNAKILSLIAEKQDETLKGKSLKQLEALLEE